MLRNFLLLSAFLILIPALALKADNQPYTVDVKLGRAYVPKGFDDNDRIQIAVEGLFSNACFRVGPHHVQVDVAKKTITVQQQAYQYGIICLQIIIPFTTFFDVGIVPAGSYAIIDSYSKEKVGQLDVARSNNKGPDDFLYAPITDAYLLSEASKNKVVLNGSFPDQCSTMEEVRVEDQGEVIVVRPLMKRNGENCVPAKTPFTKTVELQQKLHGLYFLHVRSLNGQAINRMIEIPNESEGSPELLSE